MEDDPFGNLADGDRVLDILDRWTRKGDLAKCQPGLIRILRHRWNWKLREEVLKRLGAVQTPSDALFHQLLFMMDDDNIYYDVRIIAAKALIQLLRNAQWTEARQEVCHSIVNVVTRLRRVPQPPLFNHVLKRVSGELPV